MKLTREQIMGKIAQHKDDIQVLEDALKLMDKRDGVKSIKCHFTRFKELKYNASTSVYDAFTTQAANAFVYVFNCNTLGELATHIIDKSITDNFISNMRGVGKPAVDTIKQMRECDFLSCLYDLQYLFIHDVATA